MVILVHLIIWYYELARGKLEKLFDEDFFNRTEQFQRQVHFVKLKLSIPSSIFVD